MDVTSKVAHFTRFSQETHMGLWFCDTFGTAVASFLIIESVVIGMSMDFDTRVLPSSKGSYEGSSYPLAIVGFSCCLPDASSPGQFWENLVHERVSIRPVGAPRLPDAFYAPSPCKEKKVHKGRSYSNLAALVDYETFCNDEVPRLRAEFADHGIASDSLPKAPGHLLALKVALEALRSSGVDPFRLPTTSIGVFCGLVSGNGSDEFAPVHPHAASLADVLTGLPSFLDLSDSQRASALKAFLAEQRNSSAMGRAEFLSSERPHELVRSIQSSLGLTGAGYAFDATCSSSLLAFELARNYLQSGAIDEAIVGGATFIAPSGLVHYANASSCSATGSFPFDDRADGLVAGEGCVFAVVKSLAKAVASNDPIMAVIRGIGFSSDGRGKSLWAPSSAGQRLAYERAFQDSGYQSWSEIDKIEAHATSTRLGDATELQSLASTIAETSASLELRIPITSVKANVGHLLKAAGAASLLKTVLELTHEEKLKQSSFSSPTRKFDWDASSIRVLRENESWKRRPGHIRKASVQAFGVGGLNAQVLVEGAEGASNVGEQVERAPLDQIAIIGVGCVLPGAFDASSFKSLVDRGESAITPLPHDRRYSLFTNADREDSNSLYYKARGGFVTGYVYDWKRRRIQPNHIKNANPLQFMTLGAADQAILSAGYRTRLDKVDPSDVANASLKVLDSHSTAVVVGTRSDGDFTAALDLELQTPAYQTRLEKALESEGVSRDRAREIGEDFFTAVCEKEYPCLKDETGSFTTSTLASRIAKTYDLMGGGFTLDSGNVSSFTALNNASALLARHSDLRAVICVVGHRSMNSDELRRCAAAGTVPGEGAVAFLLKRVADAREDGDTILAVISKIEEERLDRNDVARARKRLDEFASASALMARGNRPLFVETLCESNRVAESLINDGMRKFASPDKISIFGETRRSARELIGDLRPVSGAVAILDATLAMQETDDDPRAVISQWDQDGMVAQITLEKAPIETKRLSTRSSANILTRRPSAGYYVSDSGTRAKVRDFDAPAYDGARSGPTFIPSVFCSAATERVVSYSGAPYEIGLARGRSDGDRIRRALRRYADVAGSTNEKLLPTVTAYEISRAREVFGESGYDELRGLADGAETPLGALIRHNLSAFPTSREYVSEFGGIAKPSGGCAHFAGATLDGEFVHGGNIDAPIANILPNALASRIATRRPKGGYASVLVLLTGLIGCCGGVNERGLAVTTCDLLDDVYRDAPREGMQRGIVLQTILDRCATVEEGIEFLRTAQLSGAKSIGLSDAQGATALVEYAGAERASLVVQRWFGANHAQGLPSALARSSAPSHSLARYERLRELLGDAPDRLSRRSEDAFAVLRDEYDAKRASSVSSSRFRTLNMILRSDNAFSWLFYRNEGVIRFQRAYSSAIEPETSDSSLVFAVKEIMPEYRPTTGRVQTSPRVDFVKRVEPQFNPFMKAQDYLANIDADYALASEEGTATVRYEDRVIPLPPRRDSGAAPTGRVLIVSATENALARKVSNEISARGGDAKLLTLLDGVGAVKSEPNLQKELAEVAREKFPERVLFLTSYDAASDVFQSKEAWTQARAQSVAFPVFALREWYKTALERQLDLTKLSVVAATRMGGMLGSDGRATNPLDGVLIGLARSFQAETFGARNARVFSFCVDHEYDADVETVARDVMTELQRDAQYVEDVGYREGKRYGLRLSARRQVAAPRSEEPRRPSAPVWIVTGGRRGVTAELAYALGTRFGAKLCLIGSSDPAIPGVDDALALDAAGLKEFKKRMARVALDAKKKPAEEWARFERALETRKTLKRFQDAKIEVESYSCDLSDFDAARALTRRLIAKHGRIDGVLFGAGFEKSELFEKSSEATTLKTLDIKAGSAVAILSAFDGENYPKTLVGMGSIAARLGTMGQLGYCVANNVLAKTLAAFAARRADCKSTIIHWAPWDGVGMAVRPESRYMLELLNIPYMPLREGVDCFVDELNGERRPYEICRTAPEYFHWHSTHPCPYLTEEGLAPVRECAKQTTSAARPLVYRENVDSERIVARLTPDPNVAPFLVEHQFKGRPILPFVMALEIFAETVNVGADDGLYWEFDSVKAINGLVFNQARPYELRASASRNADGFWNLRLEGDRYGAKGEKINNAFPYYSGRARCGSAQNAPKLVGALGACDLTNAVEWIPAYPGLNPKGLYHGPRLRNLKKCYFLSQTEALGEIIAPRREEILGAESDAALLDVAVFDAAFWTSGALSAYAHSGKPTLPESVANLRGTSGRIEAGSKLIVHATIRERTPLPFGYSQVTVDFTVYTADGSPRWQATGFRLTEY